MKEDYIVEKLQGHSKQYIEMALQTDLYKPIENADGYGKRTGECGDTVEIFLKLSDTEIEQVGILIDGCLNTNACANTLASMAQGKAMASAWRIAPDHIVDYLETLPKHETHCAELACGAFYLALRNAQENIQQPWKKIYN